MSDKGDRLRQIRREILERTADYVRLMQADQPPFQGGTTPVHYAGRVFGEQEVVNLVDASLDFWLTAGPNANRLEGRLAKYLGVQHCLLVNSGSSANLLAFTALTSPQLGDRRILRGDEVITVAAGFPTTVAPIVQYGAVPVFVDVRGDTANIDVSLLEEAFSPRTKAVMLAHTLGNPFDVEQVLSFCERHGLWLIEDNCDALGATYRLKGDDGSSPRRTGTFGHLSTSSFYPPHHMTTGEGGAVFTSDPQLAAIVESLRDWGRDCYCASGRDNTCGKRFDQSFGDLPHGYDHKYVYAHFGYNLKMTDLQAAIGLAQVDRLPEFVEARRRHAAMLATRLKPFEDLVQLPVATPSSEPSWFGLLMSVRAEAPFTRRELVQHLEAARVQTRMLFAGNLIRHPCFDDMRDSGTGYRVVGGLRNTDVLMAQGLWVGVYPGLSAEKLDYMATTFESFLSSRRKSLLPVGE